MGNKAIRQTMNKVKGQLGKRQHFNSIALGRYYQQLLIEDSPRGITGLLACKHNKDSTDN